MFSFVGVSHRVHLFDTERDALNADANFRQPRTDVRTKSIAIHAKIFWRVSKPNESWLYSIVVHLVLRDAPMREADWVSEVGFKTNRVARPGRATSVSKPCNR